MDEVEAATNTNARIKWDATDMEARNIFVSQVGTTVRVRDSGWALIIHLPAQIPCANPDRLSLTGLFATRP
jgi:hypothetical protein